MSSGAMLSGLWRIARQLLREARRLSDEEPDPTPGPEALRAAADQWMRAHGYVRIAAPGDFICSPQDLTLTLCTSPPHAGWQGRAGRGGLAGGTGGCGGGDGLAGTDACWPGCGG
ncbi:hypothetical protein ACFQ4K_18465 [Tistrella bauzanensis]